MNRVVLAGLLALFALAPYGSAQCRSRSYGTYSSGYSYSPSYSYPSYSYVAPTYSYVAPAYEAPAKVVKQEYEYEFKKFVLALPLAVLPTYGAAYQPPPTPQAPSQAGAKAAASEMQQLAARQDQILAALKDLDGAVRQLDARVSSIERAGRFQAPPAKEAPKAEQAPPPKKDEEPAAKQQPAGAKLTAAQVSQQKCAACHQAGNESHGGDFVLSDARGAIRLLSDKELRSMGRALSKGTMPKINKRATEHGITAALSKDEAEALYAELDRQISLESK